MSVYYKRYFIDPKVYPLEDGSGFVTEEIFICDCLDYRDTQFFPRPAIVFPTKEDAVAAATLVARKVIDRGYDSNFNPYARNRKARMPVRAVSRISLSLS